MPSLLRFVTQRVNFYRLGCCNERPKCRALGLVLELLDWREITGAFARRTPSRMKTMEEKGTPNIDLEEIKVKGNQLVDKFREIIEEGNARRISIRREGRTIMEFPLSVGVGGATAAILLSPTIAAIGAFASLVSDVNIVVERRRETPTEGVEPIVRSEPGDF